MIWRTSPINIISPTSAHLYRIENGNYNVSSEEHLKNSKSSRGSYLDLELSIWSKYLISISWPSPIKGLLQGDKLFEFSIYSNTAPSRMFPQTLKNNLVILFSRTSRYLLLITSHHCLLHEVLESTVHKKAKRAVYTKRKKIFQQIQEPTTVYTGDCN